MSAKPHNHVSPRSLIYRYLDTNGDGTGTKNAVGDYSTPTDFYIAPPAGTAYSIERLIVHIEDNGTLSPDKYGALTALSNGIDVEMLRGAAVLCDFNDGLPITHNGDWGRNSYDWSESSFGAGNNIVQVRLTFSKTGSALYLNGNLGDKLVIRMNDNLTGLVEHYFMVQGISNDKDY